MCMLNIQSIFHTTVSSSLLTDLAQSPTPDTRNDAGTFGPCLCQERHLAKRSLRSRSPIRYRNYAGTLALASAEANHSRNRS